MNKKACPALILILVLAFSGLLFACSAVVTVEFDTTDGSEVSRQLLSYGNFAQRPENPVRTGYTFENWYTDNDYTKLFDFNNTKITKNTVIYAKWKVNSYTLSFVTQGTAVPALAYNFGQSLDAFLESYRTGYRFTGWYTDAACTLRLQALTMPAENITLYAGWQSDAGYSAFTFAKNETGYTLVSVEDIRLSVLPVPETYNNLPVNSIGKFAFELAKRIAEVELPDSIKIIEESAFEGCFALKSVKLPPLKALSPRLFYGCTALESVNFPDSLTSIGTAVFYGCTNLSDIKLPDGLISIGERAFYGCVLLGVYGGEGMLLPSAVSEIGDRAFSGCKFTSVKLPDALKHLNSNAFYNCDKLETIVFGTNIKSIGSGAFENCIELSSVDFPDSLVRIDSRAFAFTGLKSMTLPNGIAEVGEYVFFDCGALTSVKMPYLSRVGSYMFLNCVKLSEVEFSEGLVSIGAGAFENCTSLKNTALSEAYVLLESIGAAAFKNCPVTEVVLPQGISEISASVFENCRALKRVSLTDGLLRIGDYAFSGCLMLNDINLPAALKEIGSRAFSGCGKLSAFDFGDNLLNIGGYAFDGTGWLNSYGGGDVYAGKVLYLYKGGSDFRPDTAAIAGGAFLGNKNLTVIDIPESVKVIGDYAFKDCTTLEIVSFSALSVGTGVFYGCTALVSISFGENLAAVSDDMFYGCTALEEIILPDNISVIGARAFYGCTGLNNIKFPSQLLVMKNSAFEACKAIKEITLPDSLPEIGARAFYGCDNLNSIKLPSQLLVIKNSAFEACKALEEITLPDSLTEIGVRAFYGCENLKKVSFGDTPRLESIKASAFESCRLLEEIELPDSLKEIMNFAFKETALRHLTIGTGIQHIREQIVLSTRIAETDSAKTTEEYRVLTVIVKGKPIIELSSFMAGDWLRIILPDDFYLEIKSGNIAAGNENWAAYSKYIYNDACLLGDWLIQNNCLVAYLDAGVAAKGAIKIPDGITEIAPYTFSGMDFITSVEFNPALARIGERAFYATMLTKIKLPEGIKTIGAKAFWVKNYLYKIDVEISLAAVSHTPATLGANVFKIRGYYTVLRESNNFYKFEGDSFIYGSDGKVVTEVEDSVLAALEKAVVYKKIIFIKNTGYLQAYKQAWAEYSAFFAE